MDLYLTVLQGEQENPDGFSFQFPSPPEEITVESGATFFTFTLLNIGDTNIPNGEDLQSVSWTGYFFGEARIGMAGGAIHTWQDPEVCKNQILTWQSAHQKLRLNITKTWVNLDVYIESFEWHYSGGFGDIKYTIKLQQAKNPEITMNAPQVMDSIPGKVVPDDTVYTCDTSTTVPVAPGGTYTCMIYCTAGRPNVIPGTGSVCDVTLKSRRDDNWYFTCTATGEIGESSGIYINGSPQPQFRILVDGEGYGATMTGTIVTSSASAYVVNPGDTIWFAALKIYHDGSQWRKLYEANKQLIEETAVANGRNSSELGKYLYAGTQLLIP